MSDAFAYAWDRLWPLFAMGLGTFVVSVVRLVAVRRGMPRVAVRDGRLAAARDVARGRGRRMALEHARYRECLGPARALPMLAVVSVGWALVVGTNAFRGSHGICDTLHDHLVRLLEHSENGLACAFLGYASAALALGLRAACGVLAVAGAPTWLSFEMDAWSLALRSTTRRTLLLFGIAPCTWFTSVFLMLVSWGYVLPHERVRGLPAGVALEVGPTDCLVTVHASDGNAQPNAGTAWPACVREGADVVIGADDGAPSGEVIVAVFDAYGRGASRVRLDPFGNSGPASAGDDRRLTRSNATSGMAPDREPESSTPSRGAELGHGLGRAPCVERPEPRAGRWDEDRRYWLETDGVAGLDDRFRVVVCASEEPRVFARIDPNPGGSVTPSFRAQLTAGDNVLMQWGCGSNCGVARLVTAIGRELPLSAVWVDVSPDREFGIGLPDWVSPTGAEVTLVDLRTGRTVSTRHVSAYSREVRWTPHEVTVELEPPDGRTLRFRTARR